MMRDTVGKASYDLLQKSPDSRDPIELEREMHKEYEDHVFQAVSRGKQDFIGDFYIVVITKKERLMQNVLRNLFTARQSCPTPDYDQAVYKFHRTDEMIEFLWVIPSKDTCEHLRDHALEVVPSEHALRDFVLSFYDGSLLTKAKQLNGECAAGILLEK